MVQKSCNLKDVQKLHGKLANFAQACEFMKGFRYNLLELLKKFEGKTETRKLAGQTLHLRCCRCSNLIGAEMVAKISLKKVIEVSQV